MKSHTHLALLSILTIIAAFSSACSKAPTMDLETAVIQGQNKIVMQHITIGTDLNAQNPKSGSTPLMIAALGGRDKIAAMLIDAGANLEIKNNEGSTALHTAAFLCRTETVKHLLQKGANKEARNNAGATALDSVAVPFAEIRPLYMLLIKDVLVPLGFKLDIRYINNTRPTIVQLLTDS